MFGRLKALEYVGLSIDRRDQWRCLCECGNSVVVKRKVLINGNTKSCGCLARDSVVARNKSYMTHGMSNTRTFFTWSSMKERCGNSSHKSFDRYGGRGISVCERWLESFENFYADMGEAPEGMSLDREKNDLGYSKENCRWATQEVQANNRENNVKIEFKGVIQTIAQWARSLGMSRQTLRHRIRNGWTIEDALTMGLNHGNAWIRGTR